MRSSAEIVADAGFKGNFYVAPGAGNWNSFSGRLDVAQANITLAAEEGRRHGASGLLLTAWGDNGHHQPWPTLFPALIMGAQAAWGCPIDDDALPKQIDAAFLPRRSSGSWRCDLCTGEDRRPTAATRAAEQRPAHRIFYN